jgi:ferritin
MLSTKMQDAFNAQITREFYASQLYLAMSAHFESVNLRGFAHWMRLQSEEEREHALKLFDFVLERGGSVELGPIEQPPGEFGAPVEIFQESLAHERRVTGWINEIYTRAASEQDYASQVFLQWFIDEQVEEEANATEMIDRLLMAGDNKAALMMLDAETKSRE